MLRKITPKKDGTAQVLLRPYLPEDMNHAQMSIETHWGTIRLEWNKNDNRVSYKVTLPGRVSGKVLMPDGHEKDVSAGDFTFSW